jgi:hypothetical protein
VTDTPQDMVELRALVSARNPSQTWDLRCEVREKLIAFLQAEYPQSLPRRRIEKSADSSAAKAVSDAGANQAGANQAGASAAVEIGVPPAARH